MFWYRIRVLILVVSGFTACVSENKPAVSEKVYFDLEGYFRTEALRLGKLGTPIEKTVYDNGKSEKRTVSIDDWESELQLFTGSDINRTAWKNSYFVERAGNTTTYMAKEAGLRTRMISFSKDTQGRLISLKIENKTENMLYTSEEKLRYYPDSLYSIDKSQNVKMLGFHHYKIEGKWQLSAEP